MRCMRYCLKDSSYKTLMKTYSDFVVSCGSGLAPVNVFIARENNARNVVVMKPGIFMGLNKFSLALIPRHDNVKRAKNVVETSIAPNLIDEPRLRSGGEKLKERLGVLKDKTIGLFIGGDNPEFSLTKEIAGSAVDSALKFCASRGAELLVTTSRRTPRAVEDVLREKLKDDPRCRLLVIANENNFDEAVAGILSLGKVHIVSEESVSMVSEAISAGKHVIAFRLGKKTGAITKHERALRWLEESGYLAVTEAPDLAAALEKIWDKDAPAKPLNESDKILEAVKRLI